MMERKIIASLGKSHWRQQKGRRMEKQLKEKGFEIGSRVKSGDGEWVWKIGYERDEERMLIISLLNKMKEKEQIELTISDGYGKEYSVDSQQQCQQQKMTQQQIEHLSQQDSSKNNNDVEGVKRKTEQQQSESIQDLVSSSNNEESGFDELSVSSDEFQVLNSVGENVKREKENEKMMIGNGEIIDQEMRSIVGQYSWRVGQQGQSGRVVVKQEKVQQLAYDGQKSIVQSISQQQQTSWRQQHKERQWTEQPELLEQGEWRQQQTEHREQDQLKEQSGENEEQMSEFKQNVDQQQADEYKQRIVEQKLSQVRQQQKNSSLVLQQNYYQKQCLDVDEKQIQSNQQGIVQSEQKEIGNQNQYQQAVQGQELILMVAQQQQKQQFNLNGDNVQDSATISIQLRHLIQDIVIRQLEEQAKQQQQQQVKPLREQQTQNNSRQQQLQQLTRLSSCSHYYSKQQQFNPIDSHSTILSKGEYCSRDDLSTNLLLLSSNSLLSSQSVNNDSQQRQSTSLYFPSNLNVSTQLNTQTVGKVHEYQQQACTETIFINSNDDNEENSSSTEQRQIKSSQTHQMQHQNKLISQQEMNDITKSISNDNNNNNKFVRQQNKNGHSHQQFMGKQNQPQSNIQTPPSNSLEVKKNTEPKSFRKQPVNRALLQMKQSQSIIQIIQDKQQSDRLYPSPFYTLPCNHTYTFPSINSQQFNNCRQSKQIYYQCQQQQESSLFSFNCLNSQRSITVTLLAGLFILVGYLFFL